MAGSEMVSGETISIHQHISTLRKNLIEQGVVQAQDDQSLFAEDHVFPSPSTAAGVILGRSTDGRKDWKTAEGVTLKQLQTTAENNEDVQRLLQRKAVRRFYESYVQLRLNEMRDVA
ncbi:MAG: DUF4357 domain-containing protein [Pirellulaceae bacterium]|nr:DUF4357 domain-containing protein [Pirellulaceae bacterium]